MSVEFFQVDVFGDTVYQGNPLAVFPNGEGLSRTQMQTLAREMNLSETTFVTNVRDDSYDVRIFTPESELPFAGHPTLGTAWVLQELELLRGDEIWQRSAAGVTVVRSRDDVMWFERTGESEADLDERDVDFGARIARALGLDAHQIGLEARELGRAGRLRPAYANAGVRELMVPLRDLASLESCRPRSDLLAEASASGAYCFTAPQAGRVRARGFFPRLGIAEDPATGAAAAALGLYLARSIGAIELQIAQGIEMGRPSRIEVRAEPGRVEVGGSCHLVLTGRLERVP
ncbi:MAG: PhzF family phenazine biosynthesis protein [Actinomycetota bacterium]